jgi:hypothetical protein
VPAEPLNGKLRGLAGARAGGGAVSGEKGVRCVGTDGPMGGRRSEEGVDDLLGDGRRGMVAVEYPRTSARCRRRRTSSSPVKIRGCHGGPGRAIALY